jgi:hypothetical protein
VERPALGSVCEPLLFPLALQSALPLDVLGPISAGFPVAEAVVPAPGPTTEVPGLDAQFGIQLALEDVL